MTWLVFGVSCLLVLAGAVSIISGAPYIQLERGWAEVISGTVALSSGGVVFALAGILMRLESLRDTLAARTQPTEVAVAPPAPAPASIEPALPPAAPDTIADARPAGPRVENAPDPAEAAQSDPSKEPTGGLWKRVKRPGTERPDATTLREGGFPDRVLPDAPEEVGSPPPVVVPAHAVPPAPAPEPPQIDTRLPREIPTPARDDGQIGWMERSLFRARTPATAVSARPEPTFDPPAPPAEAENERPTGALEQGSAAEPQPTPDLASEYHEGATVVGRYQAGSASYVMYSDGTIEVETESGEIHRFGSMDELKAYIARQDVPVM